MEDSGRDKTQVHGNMEGTTQGEATQNYTSIDFGPETQVFPGEDDRRGIQEDDATRTKTKTDKTNEVRAKLATGSKRAITLTGLDPSDGTAISLPPPFKCQKIPKDSKEKKKLMLKVHRNTSLRKVAVRSCGQPARVFLI